MSRDDSVPVPVVKVGPEAQRWAYGSAPRAGSSQSSPITDPSKLPGMHWHPEAACDIEDEAGNPEHCVIHRPSLHHMRKWPVFLRASTLIERICKHGVGHPDPDSLSYFDRVMPEARLDVHGCCGCCRPPAKPLGHGNNIPVSPEEDEYFGDPNQYARSNR